MNLKVRSAKMKSSKSYKTLFTGYHLLHNEIYLSLSEILEELSIDFSAKYALVLIMTSL